MKNLLGQFTHVPQMNFQLVDGDLPFLPQKQNLSLSAWQVSPGGPSIMDSDTSASSTSSHLDFSSSVTANQNRSWKGKYSPHHWGLSGDTPSVSRPSPSPEVWASQISPWQWRGQRRRGWRGWWGWWGVCSWRECVTTGGRVGGVWPGWDCYGYRHSQVTRSGQSQSCNQSAGDNQRKTVPAIFVRYWVYSSLLCPPWLQHGALTARGRKLE